MSQVGQAQQSWYEAMIADRRERATATSAVRHLMHHRLSLGWNVLSYWGQRGRRNREIANAAVARWRQQLLTAAILSWRFVVRQLANSARVIRLWTRHSIVRGWNSVKEEAEWRALCVKAVESLRPRQEWRMLRESYHWWRVCGLQLAIFNNSVVASNATSSTTQMWATFCLMVSAAQKNSAQARMIAVWRVNAVEGPLAKKVQTISLQLDAMERDTLHAFAKYEALVDAPQQHTGKPLLPQEFRTLQEMHNQLAERAERQHAMLQQTQAELDNSVLARRAIAASLEQLMSDKAHFTKQLGASQLTAENLHEAFNKQNLDWVAIIESLESQLNWAMNELNTLNASPRPPPHPTPIPIIHPPSITMQRPLNFIPHDATPELSNRHATSNLMIDHSLAAEKNGNQPPHRVIDTITAPNMNSNTSHTYQSPSVASRTFQVESLASSLPRKPPLEASSSTPNGIKSGIDQLNRDFDAMDTNNDGVVDRQEYIAAMSNSDTGNKKDNATSKLRYSFGYSSR